MTMDRPAGTDASSAVPDDPEQLRQEIERTRARLGETVDALMAKTDVKAQARERAGHFSQRLKDMTAQAKEQTTARVGQAGGQLAGKTADARSAALRTSGSARNQLQARAATVGGAVRDATPEPVQRAARQATLRASTVATQRRGLAAGAAVAVAGVAVVGLIVIRRRRRR